MPHSDINHLLSLSLVSQAWPVQPKQGQNKRPHCQASAPVQTCLAYIPGKQPYFGPLLSLSHVWPTWGQQAVTKDSGYSAKENTTSCDPGTACPGVTLATDFSR